MNPNGPKNTYQSRAAKQIYLNIGGIYIAPELRDFHGK